VSGLTREQSTCGKCSPSFSDFSLLVFQRGWRCTGRAVLSMVPMISTAMRVSMTMPVVFVIGATAMIVGRVHIHRSGLYINRARLYVNGTRGDVNRSRYAYMHIKIDACHSGRCAQEHGSCE